MKRLILQAIFGLAFAAIGFGLANRASAQPATPDPNASSQRTLAPGVLTVIPPAPQEAEMFSGPRPLVELPLNSPGLDYSPNFTPKSSTVFERSKEVTFRRAIWNLEFAFKPVRMIYVDVPQPTGKMQRKLVWYMVYRVRNIGGHLQPIEPATPEAGVNETVNAITGARASTIEKQVVNEITETLSDGSQRKVAIRFFPEFILQAKEYNKEYLDRIIPAALAPIKAKEFPGEKNVQLFDSQSISEVAIPVSDAKQDYSVWGVAMWENVDPRIDYFSVLVQGLTNAYRFTDPAGAYKPGDPPGTGRKMELKTLQLNFWRPSDTIDPSEEEIRYGVRIEADPVVQQKIFDHYGIHDRLDYLWIYR